MTPASERLIIFTRYPRPGKAKTRMIPLLGRRGAADLARRMIEHTFSWAGSLSFLRGVDVEVHYEGAGERLMKGAFGEWGDRFRWHPQTDGDLGTKMANAFAHAFGSGARSAVIVGTDIPDLTDRAVGRAFDMLAPDSGVPVGRHGHHDIALGPARDGGYYLIGFTNKVPERKIDTILTDIPWGTDRVLETTRVKIEKVGLSCGLLDVLDDVDLPRDLRVWRRALKRKRADASRATISVIVPALNEEAAVGAAIGSARLIGRSIEIIVVDGGSADKTVAVARASGATVIGSPPPRSRQMNAGARAAHGDVLVFLHADTRLPGSYDRHIFEALSRPDAASGAFELGIDGDGFPLRLVEYVANARSRLLQLPYGDQAIFVPAALFYEIGGFPEIPIMDDFELIRRLKRRGDVAVVPLPVATSARRWAGMGVIRTTLINQAIIAAYLFGVSPERIAGWYRRKEGIGASHAVIGRNHVKGG